MFNNDEKRGRHASRTAAIRHKQDFGKSPKRRCRQDSPDRMAKIRLPAKKIRQMRRNHGCRSRLCVPAFNLAQHRNEHLLLDARD
jgi:hypothetical protein